MNETDILARLETDFRKPVEIQQPLAQSKMRPDSKPVPIGTVPLPPGGYYGQLRLVRNAVRRREGLIYGRLDANGQHCAVGSFFADHPGFGINTDVMDEIAAYNDSIPVSATPRQRRAKVLGWLNRRLFWAWTNRG